VAALQPAAVARLAAACTSWAVDSLEAVRRAEARNSLAAAVDSPEVADNNRHPANNVVRKGRDGSPEGRHKAGRMN
jgi:hypothetical protein